MNKIKINFITNNNNHGFFMCDNEQQVQDFKDTHPNYEFICDEILTDNEIYL